jgi:hypothetical protein
MQLHSILVESPLIVQAFMKIQRHVLDTQNHPQVYIVTGRCHSTDADLVSAVTNADIVTATTDMHCDWVEAFQR